MKVLFTVSPTRDEKRPAIVAPPLGLLYLAAAVIGAGHEAELLDAQAEGLGWADFERKVVASDAGVAVLTVMTPTWDTGRRAAQVLKKSGKTVMIGGPHVTVRGGEFFNIENDAKVDIAVAGEGEGAIVEILEALDSGKDVSDIAGVITRDRANAPRPLIDDIDSLPLPARKLLNNRLYEYPMLGRGPASTLFTSRGCPHSCVFCDKNVFGSRVRMHSTDRVIEELNQIVCVGGVNNVIIYDDLFTLDRERVIGICRRIIESGLRFTWKCEGRVDGVDSEMLDWMRRAGCSIVAYGIETVHADGLRFLGKGASPFDASDTISMTRAAGMEVTGYFLVGIPGETVEHVRQTARAAARWGVGWAQFSVLSPIEGTPLWDMAREEGWYGDVDALNPFDADLARPALLDGYWNAEKLREALYIAHREFYGRPSYVLARFRKAGGLKGVTNLMRHGIGLAGWMRRSRK